MREIPARTCRCLPSWRRLLAYDAFLFAASLVGVLASVVLHEVVGHCGVAWLLGAKVDGLEIGMASGRAHFDFPDDTSRCARAAAVAGGMVVNVVVGAVALLLASRLRRRRRATYAPIALVCFAAACLLGTTAYLSIGLHYGIGDPADVVDRLQLKWFGDLATGESRAWIAPTLLTPAVSFVVMRSYLPLQEAVLPAYGWLRRVGMTTLTLGVIAACFMGLALTAGRSTDPTGLPEEIARVARVRKAVARGKRVVAAARELRVTLEGRPTSEIDAAVDERVAFVAGEPLPFEERAKMVPLNAITTLLIMLSGIIAVVTDRRALQTDAGPKERTRLSQSSDGLTP